LLKINNLIGVSPYLDNWSKFTPGKNPVGFFINACIEKYDIPKTINNKPIQETNYTQREYDDKFLNSLYKNYELVNDELEPCPIVIFFHFNIIFFIRSHSYSIYFNQ